jgi:hypothetical protein
MNKQIMTFIKQARIDKDWSQYRLAKEARIVLSGLSVYESFKKIPSHRTISILLVTLGIGINMDKFVLAIVDYQKKHGFTITQLSRLLNTGLPRLYAALNKKCEYSHKTICKICKDINLPLEEFLIKPKC